MFWPNLRHLSRNVGPSFDWLALRPMSVPSMTLDPDIRERLRAINTASHHYGVD